MTPGEMHRHSGCFGEVTGVWVRHPMTPSHKLRTLWQVGALLPGMPALPRSLPRWLVGAGQGAGGPTNAQQ